MKIPSPRCLIHSFLLLVFCLAAPLSTASAENATPPPDVNRDPILFGFDVLPLVGTSSAAADRPRMFSLNLIGGLSGGTRLFELGGAFNLNSGYVQGLQIAGAFNAVNGAVSGVQIAGALNLSAGFVRGVQVAGAVNVNDGFVQGLQLAGGVNVNDGDVRGIQISGGANVNSGNSWGIQITGGVNVTRLGFSGLQTAGGINVSGKDVSGLRFSGGANVNGGEVAGLQASGGVNVNKGNVSGLQIAGGANVNGGDTQGVQIAPINYTHGHAGGLSLGVVNISESADASIAPIGIYLGGYVKPEIHGSDEGLLMAGIRHGSRRVYHVYSLGTRPFQVGDDGPTLAASLGLGWRFELGDRVEISTDVTSTWGIADISDWDWDNRFMIYKFRPLISVAVLDFLTIFGGPTLSLSHRERADAVDPAADGLIHPWELSDTVSLWPGFTLGLRFL